MRPLLSLSIPAHALFVTNDTEDRRKRKEHDDDADRLNAIRSVDIFRSLGDEDLEELATGLLYSPYAAGETLTRQGDKGHHIYLIVEGKVSIRVAVGGREREVATLDAGRFFGERSLMTGEPRSATVVALTDTSIALLAGLAIFPIVIAFGLDPAGGGPGLIFNSLPLAFEAMPFGTAYGLLFFGLLAIAAWTSSISLLEPGTAYLTERSGLKRRKGSALLLAGVSWAVGLLSVLSLNVWSDVKVPANISVLGGKNIMDVVEFLANDLMLPLGGLLIALLAGWALSRTILREQLSEMPEWLFNTLRWTWRIVAPLLMLIVLVQAVS